MSAADSGRGIPKNAWVPQPPKSSEFLAVGFSLTLALQIKEATSYLKETSIPVLSLTYKAIDSSTVLLPTEAQFRMLPLQ